MSTRKIRVYPVDEVSSRSPAEAEARAGGLSREAVDRMWRAAGALYRTGAYPAVALCVRRHGHVIVDGAIGHVRGNAPGTTEPPVRATPATLFNLFSASKAVTAMVLHLLDDRGLVHLDDAVCEYIPEFARHGKEWITLRHVLTHRAGIPRVTGQRTDVALLTDWDRIIALLCDTKPTWAPGRRLAYHALTGGFVIGEVIRRVTGRDIRRFLRDEILDPLGFDALDYGVPPARIAEVAENAATGLPPPPPFSWLIDRALGVGHDEAVRLSNDPRFLTGIVPAGNVIGTAEEACRFYQLLLDEGRLGGTRIVEPRTVRRAVAETSYWELDLTLFMPLRYGMGFMLGADSVSIYGRHTGRAFGHLGFTNIVTYADPERDIAVALMTSGKPFVHVGLWRWLNVMRTIADVCPRGDFRSRRLRA